MTDTTINQSVAAPGGSPTQIEFDRLYRQGGAFLSAAQLTRTPLLLTDASSEGDHIIFANRAFLDFFGYAVEEVIGQKIEVLCDRESHEVLAALRENVASGHEKPLDIVLHRQDGSATTTSIIMLPLITADGAVRHHFVSFIDRTELTAANERVQSLLIENVRLVKVAAERDLLVAETNHRVKNALMQASMLLMMGGATNPHPDAAEALSAARTRLQTMAGIYDLLSKVDARVIDIGAFLQTLTPQLAPPLVPINIETHVAEGVLLSPDVAQPVALIAVELVTNAFKHAFPRRRKGLVRVELVLKPNNKIELAVADDGVGLSEGATDSLGFKLVRGLARQVGGQLQVSSSTRGTSVTLTLPTGSGATSAA